MKPYYNTPSIRKCGAIAMGKTPVLLKGDEVYKKKNETWDRGVVTMIYLDVARDEDRAMVELATFILDISVKKIYWQPSLRRWEYI